MRIKTFLPLLLCMMIASTSTWASTSNKAIMLTVFGTSTEAAVTFDELLPKVESLFPDRDVVVPYTSGVIRNKLNAKIADEHLKILSPEEMLNKLKHEGYIEIDVISTIVFPGVEHDKLQITVNNFAKENPDIKVRYVPPLLSDEEVLKSIVNSLEKYMLLDGFNIVVAHGTHDGHDVEKRYLEVEKLITDAHSNAAMGSIEGIPDIQLALDKAISSKYENVRFIVFMFVAGDHAENDIASDDEDSLFAQIKEAGKTPSISMVDTRIGKRFASLGLDKDYISILLKHYTKNLKAN